MNVLIIIGGKIFLFDNLRLETFQKVLGAHANIKIVAEGEGFYSPDTAQTSMTDILQANKDVNLGRLGKSRWRNPRAARLHVLECQPDRLLCERHRRRDVSPLVERRVLGRLGKSWRGDT